MLSSLRSAWVLSVARAWRRTERPSRVRVRGNATSANQFNGRLLVVDSVLCVHSCTSCTRAHTVMLVVIFHAGMLMRLIIVLIWSRGPNSNKRVMPEATIPSTHVCQSTLYMPCVNTTCYFVLLLTPVTCSSSCVRISSTLWMVDDDDDR